jgi:hypothetical protein
VVVNDFLATGTGDGYRVFGQATQRRNTGIVDLDALIQYLRSFSGPVPVPRDARLRLAEGKQGKQ